MWLAEISPKRITTIALFCVLLAGLPFAALASATDGTIDSADKYAWSENLGWLNFGTSQGDIHVTDSSLTGYIWGENTGWISLNCSNGASCATVDYKVANDGDGNLSGYAWSENTGWINFNPAFGGVTINSSGDFLGYAWGENIGWIVFNCATTNSCATVNYKIKTDWRPQSARPCTSWTYSEWGTCSAGQQTRTVTSSSPSGCSGGSPVLTQTCTVTPIPGSGGGGSYPTESLQLPRAPEGGFKILINEDAVETNSRNVVLTIGAGSNTSKMAISNFSDFRNASLESYQPTKTWTLTEGEGEKIVYIRFYTLYDQPSVVFSDSIFYTTVPGSRPQVQLPPAEVRPPKERPKRQPRQPFIAPVIPQVEPQPTQPEPSQLEPSQPAPEILEPSPSEIERSEIERPKTPKEKPAPKPRPQIPPAKKPLLLPQRAPLPSILLPDWPMLIQPEELSPPREKTLPSLPTILPTLTLPEIILPLIEPLLVPQPAQPTEQPLIVAPEPMSSRSLLIPEPEQPQPAPPLPPTPSPPTTLSPPSLPVPSPQPSPLPPPLFSPPPTLSFAQPIKKLAETMQDIESTMYGLTENLKHYGEIVQKEIGLPAVKERPKRFALPQKTPVTELPPEVKRQIPSETIFAKTGDGLIEFPNLSPVLEKESQPKIAAISGKRMQLAIKPAMPVKSIKGYLVYKSGTLQPLSSKPDFNGLSLFFARPVFAESQENSVTIEEMLVLQEFEYTDPDGDGIYMAEIQTPKIEGDYEIITVADYKDPRLGKKEIRMTVVIDPEGYIFERDGEKEVRISGATVSIFRPKRQDEGSETAQQFELWPAQEYSQVNPQITDSTGTYAFLVPEDSYYIKVEAPGYLVYESDVFNVKEGRGVRLNIELEPEFWREIIDWKNILLAAAAILLIFLYFKKRRK